ncbi:hypothetical protein Xtri_02810 [Xanthomonas campestris pv. trichodesmae]|uniref:Uncharacterized protein n=3 Tax=Xanthomonas citri TaxID=346 RepID=A0AB33C921_XANCI|nr:hypothetical protein XcvCFBP7111P_05665 [Xanthomonas citri pv. vignicola]MBZ3921790.1 hypothetical protein [Xanthomonas campestris pv. trichodesmae]MBZ3926390.1 hypothetical protein [Xanthomonas citri pv. sesbaniae]
MPPRKSTSNRAAVAPTNASAAIVTAAASGEQDTIKLPSEPAVVSTAADTAVIASAAGASITADITEQTPEARWFYEVLTPFKFRGVIAKPPAWIELSDDEAEPYQLADVLGTEPSELPIVEG